MSKKKNQPSNLVYDPLPIEQEVNNRETGIDIIGTVPWGTHLCQFYKTKDDLIDILVPYFKVGLENNEFCMWITSDPLRVDDARIALSKKVKNLESYIQKGQIEILDSSEWYTKSGKFDTDEVLQGWISKEKQAREKGFDGLRLTGNTFWLEKKDWENFTNYEEIINSVIGNYRMIAICSYSLDKCNASEIIDVVSNHQFALIKRKGQWHRIESPEMMKKEVALNESKSLLETVFSSMNDAVVVLNKVGDIINFNEAFAHFCRFNNIEECRRSVSEFAKIIKAYTLDGKLLPVEEWPAIRGLKGEKGLNKEFLIERTDLGETWIASSNFAPLRNKNGDIIGVVQTMHDITERKKFEQEREHQALLLNQVQDGIIGSDPNFQITYWNKGAEQIFGYSEAEALGKTTKELLRPIYAPGEREKIIDELSRRGTAQSRIRIKHRNGTEIIAEVNSTQIADESGNATGYVVTYRDVTDRERVQTALKEAELKYRTVADNTYDFEYWLDPTGHYLYASPSCKRTTGYDAKEFLLNPSLRQKIVHPDDKRLFLDHIKYEISRKKPGELVHRIIHKDGNVKWIHHGCQPIHDENGKFIGTRGSSRDITERKQMEEALAKQHDELQTIFDTVPASIFYKDTKNRFLRVNKSFINMMNLSREELEGKSLFDLYPKEQAEAFWKDDKEVITSGKQKINIIEPVQTKKELLWVQTHKIPYHDAQGNIIGVVGFTLDITERKKAEEQLKETRDYLENLLNYANAPIIVWDKDFKIVQFNHAFEHLTGYTSKMMIGKKLSILFPQENKKESLQKIQRTLSGEYWESVEIPILRKDKDIRIALWNSANIYDNTGKNLIATIAQGTDITERKKVEEQLRETSDYLESLLNYANAPIIVWDKDFKIIRFNHAFEYLTGYTSKKVIGKNLDILFPPENKEETLQKIHRTLSGEFWESVEIPILHKNGHIRIALWNSANVYDRLGKKLIATIAQGQDITERKQIEDMLKESESRLKRAQELAHLGSWELDLINNRLTWSDEVYRIFGLKPQEFNATYKDFIQMVHPDDRATVDAAYTKSILEGRNNYQIEHRVVRKNGEIRIVLEKCENIRNKIGKVIQSIGMVQDITERKRTEEILHESEEKYRRIVENTTNVIMVTQPDSIISYLSPSCKDIFGYNPKDLIGTNPNIFHPDDIQKVQQALSRALKGEKGSGFEYRILTKHGDIKWVSHSWSPIFINKQLQSIVSVIEDISQRKETENNIKELNENLLHQALELVAANRELEAFSYSVSHDLRAPLRSIDGFSQALMEDYTEVLDKQGKEYLQRVQKASQHMGQLIDDMLKLSRLSRAEMTINKVDLSETAAIIMERFKKEDPLRKIDFVKQNNLVTEGDPNLLNILLENLLGNAWKFTKKCKRARIEFGKKQHNHETVFFIKDNGAGFDMKYANKLFIPFQRLHDDADYPGTGIGLGIVSRIIHRHGGQIWAEAEENKGATFYFTLGGKINE